MFVLHIALQGCLRAHDVEYGVTADTGGHIRYLLDLVRASGDNPAIDRIEIVTRAFVDPVHGQCYDQCIEAIDDHTRIVRLRTADSRYLAKEQLWTQHDSMVEALVAHIGRLDRWPDVIHAHYADAGALAAAVQARLGIPYVFTAHSLGQVKRAAFDGPCRELDGLDRRIVIEDRAISGAAAIIASSRDEAELQYALYEAYDPGRIRIIAPGSDVKDFADARPDPAIDAAIDRFLTDPAKPALLAIARPVTKKNLSGLVEAYGRSPALQAAANLVIVAGTREDLRTLEPEVRDNLAELLILIDRYDLYGKVAYPKTHKPSEIPAVYAYARERRGVFVNPALNEPFGLTLLEAAASGLPVVATDSGGPNDIVETCGNGLLVDPRAPEAIAAALLSILEEPARWDRYAAGGRTAVRTYDWAAHVAIYADLLSDVVAAGVTQAAPDPVAAQLLVSDIDGTLLGSSEALSAFREWHGDERALVFAVATGRSFHSAMAVLAQHHAPLPAIVISSVGSEIYHRQPGGVYARDTVWDAKVAAGWDREAIAQVIADEGGLTPQSPLEQRRAKLSYMIQGDPDAGRRLRGLLDSRGLACTIIQSHGRYLDVLPFAASKGTAVEHVRQALGLAPRQVIVAGDSGNDIEMLRSAPNAIIVGNHSDGLADRKDLSRCYVARGHHAQGILEGVAHFRKNAQRA
ncbi:HAD-IIB family hydrolase [Sphingomonas sp. TREG-RG-20F-R18-01]|uniref:HAD-IIB family hydrolase n=1 Tax=Sphingomonas sp. TREG-RG-20F-R18-01 TaxID=2914982 RepID=UPI001F5930E2|nr:HAD-IIB family hydrolase [Sphingomonas sp. TREG-RG-20F-R18-01]